MSSQALSAGDKALSGGIAWQGAKSTNREKFTGYIHQLYIRKVRFELMRCLPLYNRIVQDFNECLRKIEEQLKSSQGQSEYALYVKGTARLLVA